MNAMKPGDSIPIAGAITVYDGDDDVTDTIDFSLWSMTFGLRQVHDEYIYLADIVIEPDGVFSHEVPSDETLTMTVNSNAFYDIRIKDEFDTVVSTQTFELVVQPPIAGVP